jgi:hypothetical protein
MVKAFRAKVKKFHLLFLKFHLSPQGFSFLPPPNISCNEQPDSVTNGDIQPTQLGIGISQTPSAWQLSMSTVN